MVEPGKAIHEGVQAPRGQPGRGVTLLGTEQVANASLAVRFSRPGGFTFRAGQNVDLMLPAAGLGSRRTLSIASAPCENELLLAMRMRPSAFKDAVARMAPGDPAWIGGPHGSLVMHRSPGRDAVLIAGGIGITPFRSMLRQAAHDGDARRFTLIYSNRRPEEAAFLDELRELERRWDRFRLVATMTGAAAGARGWQGERRAIGGALVREASENMTAPVFHLAGPPDMVTTIRAALEEAGVGEDDIRGEEFFGYEYPEGEQA
jgi:ferredoxin-NADP reductase